MFSPCYLDNILITEKDFEKNSCKIGGHLPRECSRVKKFTIDREASVNAELTSNHYWRSPLLQGGLEIRCKISIKIHSHFNKTVFGSYKDIMKELHIEPMEEGLRSLLLEKLY